LDAYRALTELKQQGRARSIGVGAKEWRIIERISRDVKLDWAMIANSMTIYQHPRELIEFMHELEKQNIAIINSAVFNAGFLVGGDYYNYKLVDPTKDKALFKWRQDFFRLCTQYQVKPAQACIKFAMSAPGVKSLAFSTTTVELMKENLAMISDDAPPINPEFWQKMKEEGLIEKHYNYI